MKCLSLFQRMLILFYCSMLFACAGTQSLKTGKIFAEPEYSLSAVRFIDIDMERMRLEVDLEVTNPNYLSLEFQNVNYELNVDGIRVLSGMLKENLKVPARSSFNVTIPLELELTNLASGALGIMIKRELEYQLTTRMNSKVPILDKKTFTITKTELLRF